MGRQNWIGGTPIASRESGVHNGLWYPAIEIYSESDGPHGTSQQRFILHDGLPSNRFPVDYVGRKLDLSDPHVLIDQWRRLKTHGD
jgi:hypothetical protein